MRVLIVIHGYPPTYVGGAELRAERTARALATRGHDLAVLCVESLTASETRLETAARPQDGVQVHRLYVKSFTELADGQDVADRQIVSTFLGQLIRTWQPDVIHLFSGYLMGSEAIMTAKAHGLSVVVSVTDFWWLCHRINLVRTNGTRCDGPTPVECARCQREMYRRFRLPAHLMRPLADGFWYLTRQMPVLGDRLGVDEQARRLQSLLAALNQADAVIAPSRYVAEKHIQYGVSAKLVRVWRQGVAISRCPLRKPSPMLRFGYLGQIKHHKGVHTLIEAWGRLDAERPHDLVLYGSSQGEEAYGDQLRERSMQHAAVRWERPVPHAEIWRVLAEIDVLVVPSRWNENSPNVILEAQAIGIPVIGTNLGGIAELVQHGRNGLLFAADAADDLTAQMKRLLDEPELLAALKWNPIPFYSFTDELDQLQGLYEQLKPGARGSTAIEQEVLGPSPAYG